MKHSFLLLLAVLLAVTAPVTPARAQDDSVSIDFFYDALSPYGDWIYAENYGYVWQPMAAQQPGWSPYADGSWAFTDAGWTWISNEDFGWITYHYGRWIRMQQAWVWVPGYEWAPAWVSWRQTQGQIGWAPLPPEAAWTPNIGFGGWTDSYYDVGPSYYNFIPIGLFASATSLRPLILDRSRNFTYYDQSVNITHTTYQQNVMNHIFVGGPDPQRIDGFGGNNRVRRLNLHRDDDGFRRDWLDRDRDRGPRGNGPPRGNPSRIEQGQLFIAAPSIRRDPSHGLPSRVRESMNKPQIDRGWRGADNEGADRLRKQQRDELERSRPPNLPEKNLRPVTSIAPPPAFGRNLEPHERNGGRKGPPGATTPDPRSGKDEEVRKPGTPKNPMPDGPPGIPGKGPDTPRTPGTPPGAGRPGRDTQPPEQQPGKMPGRGGRENGVPTPGGAPEVRPGMPQGPQGGVPQLPGQKPGRGPREDKAPTPDRAPEARPGMPQGPQGGVPQLPGQKSGRGSREDKAPTPDRAPQTRPGLPQGQQGGVPQLPGQRPGRGPRENGAPNPGGAPGMRPGLPQQVPQAPPQRIVPQQRIPSTPAQPPAERPRREQPQARPMPAAPQQIIPRPAPQQAPQQRPPQAPAPQQRPPQAPRIAPPAAPQQPPAAPPAGAPQNPGGRRQRGN